MELKCKKCDGKLKFVMEFFKYDLPWELYVCEQCGTKWGRVPGWVNDELTKFA